MPSGEHCQIYAAFILSLIHIYFWLYKHLSQDLEANITLFEKLWFAKGVVQNKALLTVCFHINMKLL